MGTAPAAEGDEGKMQHSCFSHDVYIQRVVITGSPCSDNYNVTPPQELLLYCLVCRCI
jgi:hypothetical protein